MADRLSRIGSFVIQLRNRHVLRALAVYVPLAWLGIQITKVIVEAYVWIPRLVYQLAIALAIIGLVATPVLAWLLEIGPDGLLVRDSQLLKTTPGGESPKGRVKGKRGVVYLTGILLLIGLAAYSFLEIRIRLPFQAAEAGDFTIAVLPFALRNGDSLSFLAPAITEQILTRLSHESELGVISSTSVQQYQETDKTIRQIATELDADYVLEGNLFLVPSREGGTSLRVMPQLISATEDRHVWAEEFIGPPDSVFEIGAEIAHEIAVKLGSLIEGNEDRAGMRPTRVLEAEEYRQLAESFLPEAVPTEQNLRAALEWYRRALELDPGFSRVYAQVSGANLRMYQLGYDRSVLRLTQARHAAERALETDPEGAAAHLAMGRYLHLVEFDYDSALEHYQKAMDWNPNNVDLMILLADLQARAGKYDSAFATLDRAARLAPRSAVVQHQLGNLHHHLRQWQEAEDRYLRAIRLSPELPEAYAGLAELYVESKGDLARAAEVLDQGKESAGLEQMLFPLVRLRILEGKYEEALGLLSANDKERWESPGFLLPVPLIRGQILELMNRDSSAVAAYESAADSLEGMLQTRPDDPRLHTAFALALAGAGRGQEAVTEARKATELRPLDSDAVGGPKHLEGLALVLKQTGNRVEAKRLMKQLLEIPGGLTAALVSADPRWKTLTNGPQEGE